MYFAPYVNMVYGDYTMGSLPSPSLELSGRYAYVSDKPGGAGFMVVGGDNGILAWVNPPTKTYSMNGITDAGGNYTVTYPQAFAVTPNIMPVLTPPTDDSIDFRVTTESASGFTVRAFRRSGLTVLGITLLSFATTPVVGANLRVLVVDKIT